VFRYGGEELLICMPDADLEMEREILERLRTQIGALDHASDSRRFRVTASFGLARVDPVDPVELSIDRADRALYAAKAAGRNCTAVWDGSLMTAAPLA
jgi:diguanylate cyclase (GGDEF)-like protein